LSIRWIFFSILVVRLINNAAMSQSSEDAPPGGEFEGDDVVPLRGSAEPSEAPRGEVDSPLEVSRSNRGLWQGIYGTGQ
jgi:hypothetical protein